MKKCLFYRALVILGLPVLALPGFAGMARAQAAPETCEGISGVDEPSNAEVHGCLKPIINNHALISVSNAVRNVIAGRLAPGAEVPEPAGLALDGAQAVAARLAGDGAIAVEPTADIPAAVTEQRLWNAWIDGKYSWIEGAKEIDHSKGPLTNVMVGLDYRLTSSVVFGVMGTYEDSRLETEGGLPISQETEGYGGGAYVGITVTPNIIFSGMATYAAIDTELGESRDANTDSDRVQLSGAFTGYWYSGTTRFSPSLTLAWSKEWQDAYSDGLTPKQRFETGVLTGGTVVGHTFAMTGTTSIEPWAGAFIDYTFINDVDTQGPIAVGSYDEQADLRLQLGFNLNLASNVQLMLMGETSGLLLDETDTYAGEVNLAIQF
ncbi:MAG: autotransporter outer membrane beta-barrel domain-containing protein [Parvibaculaceae bacterium]